MDELRRALRPLVDSPSAGPPPVGEIAERACRRRNLLRTRRGVIAGAAGALAVALLWYPSRGSGSEPEIATADGPENVAESPTSTAPSASTPITPDTTLPDTTSPETAEPSVAEPGSSTTTTEAPSEAGPLDPFSTVQAEAHTAGSGVRVVAGPDGHQWLDDVSQGDHVAFPGLDFGTGLATRVEAHLASVPGTGAGGTVEVRLDRVDSPPIATLPVPHGGVEGDFVTISAPTVAAIGGRHDVYLTFTSPADRTFVMVDWFRFVP